MTNRDGHTEREQAAFETARGMLFGVAYAMLGQIADAEDVVQDTYIRWAQWCGTHDVETLERPEAFLRTVAARISIDRLRSARHRRESYVGPWLPEPVIDRGDPIDAVVEAEGISMALLVAFERLNPIERAVLVLRDVFDLDYDEIAGVVDRTVVNCRQISRRAHDRVGDPNRNRGPVTTEALAVRDALLLALGSGDLAAVTDALADDIVLWSDGGSEVHAARRPVNGSDKVARFLLGLISRVEGGDYRLVSANGAPAVVVFDDGGPRTVAVLEIHEGRVSTVRMLVNPTKVAHTLAKTS